MTVRYKIEITPAMMGAGARVLMNLLPEEFSLSSAQLFAEAAIRAALEQMDQK